MDIYLIYLSFQENNKEKDYLFSKAVASIESLIMKHVKSVVSYLQDDLQQEILFKLFNIFENRKFELLCFYTIEPMSIVIECQNETSFFLERYIFKSLENENAFKNRNHSKNDYISFANSYINFVGSIKMIVYLDKTFKNLTINFLKNNTRNSHTYLDEHIENQFLETKDKEINLREMLTPILTSDDIDFLECFIEDNRLLTQKEVAESLSVSQQYISKRFNTIQQKIKLKNN